MYSYVGIIERGQYSGMQFLFNYSMALVVMLAGTPVANGGVMGKERYASSGDDPCSRMITRDPDLSKT